MESSDPRLPVEPLTVSAFADPEGEPPWAMQLVVRLERSEQPTHGEVCAAAALACVSLLDDDRCAPGGVWHAAVSRWCAGRIRKHVRRARGARWEAVCALEGVSAQVGAAQVRAFVPAAVDRIPAAISRLQVSGLDLVAASGGDPAPVAAPHPGPVEQRSPVVLIDVCAEPVLSTGKAAAAAAHAAQLSAAAMDPVSYRRWADDGFALAVSFPSLRRWVDVAASAPPVVVADAGFTDVAPGTVTAVARWR